MTVTVLILGGTGFPDGGDGICAEFARNLDPARCTPHTVHYPATYGSLGESYADSRTDGRDALLDAIASASPNQVVLAGYSQGAGIAGDVAAEIGASGNPVVIACALIADPARPRGKGIPGTQTASGYGVVGERPITGMPAFWAANEGDPITALPADNPLRGLADASEYYSLRSPAAADRWAMDLIDRARRGRWQRWWSLGDIRRWGDAIAYARGYLIDGRHTTDYILGGHAAQLAATINREVAG